MRTSELTGHALDWAVAKCEGYEIVRMRGNELTFLDRTEDGALSVKRINYSTDWSQGGPIIERENIALSPMPDGLCRAYAADGTRWAPNGDEVFNWKHKQQGYHPLIAAMRCYVASKLGDEVEIPTELTQGEKK